jgi:hypothetical protein
MIIGELIFLLFSASIVLVFFHLTIGLGLNVDYYLRDKIIYIVVFVSAFVVFYSLFEWPNYMNTVHAILYYELY